MDFEIFSKPPEIDTAYLPAVVMKIQASLVQVLLQHHLNPLSGQDHFLFDVLRTCILNHAFWKHGMRRHNGLNVVLL